MLKYLTKIAMDIFPSVLATIIGAYIVNHYITAKPAADTPAAAMAPAAAHRDAKPAGGTTDVASLPAPGIKAKGISEKAVLDKPAAEKPADKATDQPAENKPAEAKPAETAAAPTAPRGRQPSPREKAIAKVTPAPVAAASAATAAAVDGSPAGTPGAAATTPDANDLARAAIERLRKMPEGAQQETAHAAEAPRVQEGPRIVTAAPPVVRPLPPPITISTPQSEAYGTSPANPPYTASAAAGADDASRPTPPADIPVPMLSPPIDLRADAAGALPQGRANVADDMLSAARSVFHAVLPKPVTPE